MKQLFMSIGLLWTTIAVGQTTNPWYAQGRTGLLTGYFFERQVTDPMNFRNVNELGFGRLINPKSKEIRIYVGATLGQLREQRYLKDIIINRDPDLWLEDRGNAEIMRNALYLGLNLSGGAELLPKLSAHVEVGINGLITNSFSAIVAPEHQAYVNEGQMENTKNNFFIATDIGVRYHFRPKWTFGLSFCYQIIGRSLDFDFNEPTNLTRNTIKAFDNSIMAGVAFSLTYQF